MTNYHDEYCRTRAQLMKSESEKRRALRERQDLREQLECSFRREENLERELRALRAEIDVMTRASQLEP